MFNRNSKIGFVLLISFLSLTAIIFNSCYTIPRADLIKPESIVIEKQSGLHLPVDARLAINMESSQLNKIYIVQKWEIDEGKRIQDAAKKVFGKLFTEALPSPDCKNPQLIAKVSGLSQIDTYWGNYKADANVILTFGNGDFIGRYTADGHANSGLVNDQNAFENAYIKAFEQIAADILNENKLAEYFNNGFTDALTASSIKNSNSLKRKKSFTTAPSVYDAFLNSVVVINSSDGIGTGFFLSSNGNIITNAHVVGSDSSVSIRLRDGRILLGSVEKIVSKKDLSLIKVSGDFFPWLVLGNLSDAPAGLEVLAIGTPQGLDWSITKGIVSAWRSLANCTLIQTDAAINPGNSGGPLISLKTGKVIGVNTLAFKKNIAEGLNFAVSSKDIIESFPEIQKSK